MRKFLQAVKAIATAALCAVAAVFAVLLIHAPVFEKGESYELYFGANSSALSAYTQNPLLDKLLLGGVAGESVRYTGDRYEEIKERFSAELLFTEEACGVVNYYLYSPMLGGGVLLCGQTVNLHVAVSGEQTAAGTPLIFGGF